MNRTTGDKKGKSINHGLLLTTEDKGGVRSWSPENGVGSRCWLFCGIAFRVSGKANQKTNCRRSSLCRFSLLLVRCDRHATHYGVWCDALQRTCTKNRHAIDCFPPEHFYSGLGTISARMEAAEHPRSSLADTYTHNSSQSLSDSPPLSK